MSPSPPSSRSEFDTDVIVIGSGLGGSVAALRFTEKGYGVWVLEKGKRWRTQQLADGGLLGRMGPEVRGQGLPRF